MGWFWKSKKKGLPDEAFEGPPRDIGWMRSPKNKFYNFLNLDPAEMGLKGVSGVYVVWRAGLRPEWVYTGHTPDLAGAFDRIYDNPDIMDYGRDGKLFITWAEIKPEFQPGVVKYLIQVMSPAVEDPVRPDADGNEVEEEDVHPIAVFLPGVRRVRWCVERQY